MDFLFSRNLLAKSGLWLLLFALSCYPHTKAYADITDLYVGLSGTNAIGLYSTSGTSLGNFVASGSGGLNDTTEFHFGPDGNLYVGGYFNTTVNEYDGQTGAFIRSLGSGLSTPFDMAFDNHGAMYVSNFGNGTVSQVDLTTGTVTRTYSGFNGPTGLMFNSSGSLLVANSNHFNGGGNVVALNTSTGGLTAFATGLAAPRDLASGPGGNIYILDSNAGKIDVAPDSGGSWTTLADVAQQYPVSSRQDTQSLVYDNGQFYVVISSDNNMGVAAYDASTGAYASAFPLPMANVDGIATKFSAASSVPETSTLLMVLVGLLLIRRLPRRKHV